MELSRSIDRITVRKFKDGMWQDVCCTNNHPSIFQRILAKAGMYAYAGDLTMDAGIQDIVTYLHDTYDYVSVGTSSSGAADSTKTELVAQSGSRILATKGYKTTYVTNDTATFLAVFTPTAVETIVETGLHKKSTSTDDTMYARQILCNIDTEVGVPYTILWEVTITR